MSTLTVSNELILSSANMQDSENFSTRLTQAMRTLDISQSELARRIGVKPQAIQYLCTSNASRSKFAFDIADALGINVDWLVAGKGKITESGTADIVIKVPLLDWSQISNWLQDNDKNIEPITYISTQINFSKKCYALRVNDCSMVPRFEIGTVLIIDPETAPCENDFVIVATKFSETPIIRQLIKRNGNLTLIPANIALYKEIALNKDDKLLGILRQTFYEFIRR